MSTTNPDERDGTFGLKIRPAVFALAILVQFYGPVLALLAVTGVIFRDPGLIIIYPPIWVIIGLAALYVPSNRSTYLLGAMTLSFLAGLFLVIQIGTPGGMGPLGTLFPAIGYTLAVLLVIFYFVREAAIRRTGEIGVDTVATVVSAPVTGMVNYVTRQRLTLRFTDQRGVERFLRVGRTGGGYSAGDTIPIRYDPSRPWSKRGVLVEGSGPTLFGGRRYAR
jgi:hypothetical protein